ncbi:hypothetical protein CMI47_03945 [Candidatus Pacearchaeota archaeon]|nr:hypothetical protein [Candidatus Pacearchaeota archaeon]|tara:strand:+ start:2799 stop:4328 length:1530 start_codon:yes stop_codon:yes gene_type:complete
MRIFSFATKDTFITDVIVTNTFRATDANVGLGGVLSLFKLHEESTLPGTGSDDLQEISRILIKFDLDVFRALTGTLLSGTKLNNTTFRLKMFDVLHGDTLPSNFNIIAFPLSRAFDEGSGIDTYAYTDIGSANFITASGETSTAVTWSLSGAAKSGALNDTDIDIITGSSFFPGLGNQSLVATQNFDLGSENLDIDISTIVSGTIVGLLPDHGFRISFSGSEETDSKTRFIKRFYSRHTNIFTKQPRIEAIFDDSLADNGSNLLFDVTGTIFLNNLVRGRYTDIVSGSRTLTGTNSDVVGSKHKWAVPVVKLESGSFDIVYTGSQHQKGLYSASFAIDSLETLLTGELHSAGSATMNIVWQSADQTIPYLSSSIVIREITRDNFIKPKRYRISITNLKRDYNINEIAQFRLFVQEVNFNTDTSKLPSETQSLVLDDMYYQIRELKTNDIIIPLDTTNNSTRLSYDRYSNYFNMHMKSFAPGINYKIEFLIKEDDIEQIIDEGIIFRVVK